ncbi:hypothetical protein [uncultured Erythrobacter sp.]|uniref:hypothetical protein n=1 Tax=uncultured Erythrobacter sp. TaxID=263913 RepID=UPI002609F2B5|nr:hypothetical protein [uncultured Erythrobacter sp.]
MLRSSSPSLLALAVAVLASGCATTPKAEVTAASELATESTIASRLCKTGEMTILDGSVQDDFGLDIAVCVAPDHTNGHALISARWEGEGGDDEVSCLSNACEGIIEYSRYTRARFTLLQIAWYKDYQVQRVSQSVEASTQEEEVSLASSHSWSFAGTPVDDRTEYPVTNRGSDLSLMSIESYLPQQSWTSPLLALVDIRPEVRPTSTGITIFHGQGERQEYPFGSPSTEVLGALQPLIGDPAIAEIMSECPNSPADNAAYPGFSLTIQEGAFTGWFMRQGDDRTYPLKPTLETGVSAGDPVSALSSAPQPVTEGTLDNEFEWQGMMMITDGAGDDARIDGAGAGSNCIFR